MDAKTALNELGKETSFWGLVRLVLRIPHNVENILIPLGAFAIILLSNISEHGEKITTTEVVSSAKDFINWYYTILGFLIAGYTIFASVTSIELSVKLAKVTEKHTKLPYLKFIHATFFKAIIIFFFSSSFTLTSVLALREWGFLNFFISEAAFKDYIISTIDALNVSLFIFSLMMLKSFLYNIYSSVIIAVGVKLQDEDVDS